LFSDWFVDYIKITNLRNGDTQQWTSDQWVSSNQILVFHNSQYQFNKEFDKISQMNDEELKKYQPYNAHDFLKSLVSHETTDLPKDDPPKDRKHIVDDPKSESNIDSKKVDVEPEKESKEEEN